MSSQRVSYLDPHASSQANLVLYSQGARDTQDTLTAHSAPGMAQERIRTLKNGSLYLGGGLVAAGLAGAFFASRKWLAVNALCLLPAGGFRYANRWDRDLSADIKAADDAQTKVYQGMVDHLDSIKRGLAHKTADKFCKASPLLCARSKYISTPYELVTRDSELLAKTWKEEGRRYTPRMTIWAVLGEINGSDGGGFTRDRQDEMRSLAEALTSFPSKIEMADLERYGMEPVWEDDQYHADLEKLTIAAIGPRPADT